MHHDLQNSRTFDRRLKLASRFIGYEIQEALNEELAGNRQKLMVWLHERGDQLLFWNGFLKTSLTILFQ